MCEGEKWKTWNLSLGGSRGTHGDARQRSCHVQVTCSKRPERSCSTCGLCSVTYGAKFARTRSRSGFTHFVSAMTARRAVMTSPKRWTVGVIDAYALSGTPSPTDEPLVCTGRIAAAGA